jgi:hypothetical protein
MVEYNYTKQVNPDAIYTNIITNVGVTPSLFSYDNVTFGIRIGFDEALTAQQEADLDATINDYIYEEAVRIFSLLPIVDVDNSQYNVSYIGYGYSNSCKIQKVTTVPTGYTSQWADGNEQFDKIWANRYSYTYF